MRAQKHQRPQPGRSGDNARPGNAAVRGRQVHPTLQLQRPIGNQAAQRLLKARGESFAAGFGANATTRAGQVFQETTVRAETPASIQPKLTVNAPGDIYEREADRVADQVMRMPEGVQRNCACSGECSGCRGQTEHFALKKEQLQAQRVREKDRADNGSTGAPPIVNEVLRSPGQPLDAETRDFMEPRFGQDFSRVRIHTDNKAVESAQAVHAQAYTVGSHIALGEGKYAPRTLQGRHLLAHELTHVLHQTGTSESAPALQRQPEIETKPAKSYPYSVAFEGCNESPHDEAFISGKVKEAFERVRDSDCVKTQSLKDEILSKFNGLKIVCKQDQPLDKCAEAIGSSSIYLYKTAYMGSLCPVLEATILHESVHFTQSIISPHGQLSWDCQESCFEGSDEPGRGKASGCRFERGRLPFASVSFGKALTGQGASTSYLRLYAGFEKRRWIASYLDASLGVSLSFIGETETGEPNDISASSKLISLIPALRLDPGKMGGGYVSLSGGLGVAMSGGNRGLGKEVAVAAGVRWHMFDLSLNAGIDHDPTRKGGADKLYTLAATLTFAPKIRR